MNEETHQKLMTIKRSFRLLMNGPGSQSMRDKGLGYKLNWGVPFYEFLDQAAVALQGDNMGVKHAAANAVMRFCDFGEDFEKIAQGALKGIFEI